MISNPYKKAASVLGFSQTSLRRWENEYHLHCKLFYGYGWHPTCDT